MPNAAPLSQQGATSNQRLGDPDRDQSPAEYSSGIDSDNDQGPNGSGGSRALKRKRPLTVSYVPDRLCHAGDLAFQIVRDIDD